MLQVPLLPVLARADAVSLEHVAALKEAAAVQLYGVGPKGDVS